MRHVSRGFLAPLAMVFLLAGCTKVSSPELEMLALSIPAPTSKAGVPSPFDQDLNEKGYLLFSGQCTSMTTGFELAIDDKPWHTVPVVPAAPGVHRNHETDEDDVADVNPTDDGLSYDVSCDDGTFSFWVFEHQLLTWEPGLSDDSPHRLLLRGTGLLPTQPLIWMNPDSGDDHHGPGPASALALSRHGGNAFHALGDQCQEFDLRIVDDRGHSVNASEDVTVRVSRQIGATIESITVYPHRSSCEAGTGGLDGDTLNIPATAGSVRFSYKANQASGVTVKMAAAVAATETLALSPASLVTFVTRDASDQNRIWPSIDVDHFLIVGSCYPMKIRLSSYVSDNVGNPESQAIVVTFAGTAIDTDITKSLVAFSSYDDCVGSVGGQNLGSYAPEIAPSSSMTDAFYVRAPSWSSMRGLLVSLSGPAIGFDPNSRHLSSATGSVIADHLEIGWASGDYAVDECREQRVELRNDENMPLPSPADVTVNLSGGSFYTSYPCSGSPVASTTLEKGRTFAKVYFVPASSGVSSISASATVGGVPVTGIREINVVPALGLFACSSLTLGSSCSASAYGGRAPYVYSSMGCYGSAVITVDPSSGLVSSVSGSSDTCTVRVMDSDGRTADHGISMLAP